MRVIKVCSVHSIHFQWKTKRLLATYMRHRRNNNLEIRIPGFSCRPQKLANLRGFLYDCPEGLCVYLQFNCNMLHHLHRARHKVSGNHKTRRWHEYVQLPNSCTNTEVSEKSEPKPSYMYQRSWSDQIAVSVNQLHHQLQTMVNNALEYCPPWISCSKQTDHPWKMKHVCINSTKILVISCMA